MVYINGKRWVTGVRVEIFEACLTYGPVCRIIAQTVTLVTFSLIWIHRGAPSIGI